MMNMQLMNRSGLAAIAAATALIATPALGQESPATSDPAPIVADEPLTVEPLPTPAPAPEAASDPLAPAATATRSTRTARPARATAAPAARAPAPAQRTTAPAETTTQVAAAPLTPTTEPTADPAMVAPLPEPVAATPVLPAGESAIDDDLLPIAGAAGLGILALAGAGFAVRRRRRNNEEALVEENWHEPAMSRPAPVTTAAPVKTITQLAAAPVAASAFNFGNAPREGSTATQPINRIEAAKRGPTPDNPSLSLKKRLKRAAFFDQRDRQIAAGKGTPVSANAGLPDAMTPVAPTAAEPARRPSPAMNMSFGKSFQPA